MPSPDPLPTASPPWQITPGAPVQPFSRQPGPVLTVSITRHYMDGGYSKPRDLLRGLENQLAPPSPNPLPVLGPAFGPFPLALPALSGVARFGLQGCELNQWLGTTCQLQYCKLSARYKYCSTVIVPLFFCQHPRRKENSPSPTPPLPPFVCCARPLGRLQRLGGRKIALDSGKESMSPAQFP